MAQTSSPETSSPERIDLSISLERANLVTTLMMVPILAVFLLPYLLLWGGRSLLEAAALAVNPLVLLPVFLVGVVVHEGLHALGWSLAAGIPLRQIAFGVQWKMLTPYAHCRIPLEVTAYRTGTLLPGVLLGIIRALAGIVFQNGYLLVYGVIFTIAAGGDFLVLWTIRLLNYDQYVEDHPTRAGCYLVAEPLPEGEKLT